MGNWRSVQIIGECEPEDVQPLREAVKYYYNGGAELHCLSFTAGLAGLPLWPAERIDARGNLAERDFTPQDVAAVLNHLLLTAPSLDVKVHCGSDYESKKCVATVLLRDAAYVVGPPEISEVPDPPESQGMQNFWAQMMRQRR